MSASTSLSIVTLLVVSFVVLVATWLQLEHKRWKIRTLRTALDTARTKQDGFAVMRITQALRSLGVLGWL